VWGFVVDVFALFLFGFFYWDFVLKKPNKNKAKTSTTNPHTV
jgi:hypothetical protein